MIPKAFFSGPQKLTSAAKHHFKLQVNSSSFAFFSAFGLVEVSTIFFRMGKEKHSYTGCVHSQTLCAVL